MKNILFSISIMVLLFMGCTDSQQESSQKALEKQDDKSHKVQKEKEADLIGQVKESTSKISQAVKEASSDVANKVSQESKQVIEKSAETIKKVEKKAQEVAKDLTDEIVEKTKQTKQTIEKSIDKIVENKKEKNSSINAKALYLKCAGCHGQEAQLKALGKSQVIKTWDKEKIKEALLGYKNGTYGAAMKGVMIAQVTSLNEEQIEALSEYIASMK